MTSAAVCKLVPMKTSVLSVFMGTDILTKDQTHGTVGVVVCLVQSGLKSLRHPNRRAACTGSDNAQPARAMKRILQA